MQIFKSLFMVAVFIPISAGYFMGGVPYFLARPEHRYMLWVTAFVNAAVIPSIIWISRQPDKEARIITAIAKISYGLGFAGAIWTQLAGQDVL